jgi:hypothetical protein
MIYIFCGVNWPATYALATFFKSHLEEWGRSAAICEVSGLEDIGRFVLNHSEEVFLLAARWISLDLIDALARSGELPIICVETPSSALFTHWLEHTGDDKMAALRETTRDLAPLIDMLARIDRSENLKMFRAEMASSHEAASQFVRDVLHGSPRPIDLDTPHDPDAIAPLDPSAFAPQPVEDKDAAGMLAALDANISSKFRQSVQLPVRMFSQPGGIPLEGPIDLTGSPRGLFFGPMLHLRSAAWTITASLLCADVTQRPKLEVDAAYLIDGVHQVLGRSEFNLIPNGRIKVSFTFVNLTPHHPLEFRLNLTQGVFHGTLTVEEITLNPASETH